MKALWELNQMGAIKAHGTVCLFGKMKFELEPKKWQSLGNFDNGLVRLSVEYSTTEVWW